MIKELWMLVKMLFGSRPSNVMGKELGVVGSNLFPFGKRKYMMWCGVVFRREGSLPLTEATMNHERIHVMQAMLCDDSWVSYYLSYLWNWLKHCPWMSPMGACYYLNKYESEAFANEGDFGYVENYDGTNLDKYDVKDAKKIWKELGGTKAAWVEYLIIGVKSSSSRTESLNSLGRIEIQGEEIRTSLNPKNKNRLCEAESSIDLDLQETKEELSLRHDCTSSDGSLFGSTDIVERKDIVLTEEQIRNARLLKEPTGLMAECLSDEELDRLIRDCSLKSNET